MVRLNACGICGLFHDDWPVYAPIQIRIRDVALFECKVVVCSECNKNVNTPIYRDGSIQRIEIVIEGAFLKIAPSNTARLAEESDCSVV